MKVLFYCQHALGMGHFVRSAALAERLALEHEVLFLNGGQPPASLPFPPTVQRIDLLPLALDDEGQLLSLTPDVSPAAALAARREHMLDLMAQHRVDVLLIELFPFGRRKFEAELVPLLEAARALPDPPLVICSLRDLLVTGRTTQQRFDDHAQALCDRYFDLVLVHADPALAALEESFRPSVPLRTPVAYTGFIMRPAAAASSRRRSGVIVSAGGGLVGEPVYRLAVEAHRRSWSARQIQTTIVAGPFAPRPVLDWLYAEAASVDGLAIVPHVPDLRPLLTAAAASVSQCGYNTALDLIATGVPAIVLPYGDERENEQRRRAERLEARGVLRCAPIGTTADALAAHVLALIGSTPTDADLMLDGLENTARLLSRALDRRRTATGTPGERG